MSSGYILNAFYETLQFMRLFGWFCRREMRRRESSGKKAMHFLVSGVLKETKQKESREIVEVIAFLIFSRQWENGEERSELLKIHSL